MPKLVVTADLHFDPSGSLTPPAVVDNLAQRIEREHPDAVVLAGDLGHPLASFRACLRAFRNLKVPVGVLAGNHDVWHDAHGPSSRELWEHHLPEAVEAAGFVWLEEQNIQLGDVAIVGSLAWYDYSAALPHLGHSVEQYAQLKHTLINDAVYVDWPWSDVEFSALLRDGLERRLARLEKDASVREVVVVTHVPIFEEQLLRKPGDQRWELANAYFGNLATGNVVAKYGKVRAVIGGHTHCGKEGMVQRKGGSEIEVHTVGSEYGRPVFITLTPRSRTSA